MLRGGGLASKNPVLPPRLIVSAPCAHHGKSWDIQGRQRGAQPCGRCWRGPTVSRNKPGCCPPGDVRGSALTAGEVLGLPPDLEGVAVLAPDASPCSQVWQGTASNEPQLCTSPPFPRSQVSGLDWSAWPLFKGTKPSSEPSRAWPRAWPTAGDQ